MFCRTAIQRDANDRQKVNNRHHRTAYIQYTLMEVVFEMGQLQQGRYWVVLVRWTPVEQ